MLKFLKKVRALIIAVPFTLLLAHSAYAGSYTVIANDSLFKIANLFDTASNTIMKTNGLSSNMIYPGQVLNVPSATYTVKSGDSLYLIAKRYGINLYSLRRANNEWDDNIYVGQRLNLPGVSTAGSQASTSTQPKSTAAKSVIPYTSGDLDLLARLITAEANGQPYTAMLAVGGVVVNRVQNPLYPNTIRGVIYQVDGGYYQFTPVLNGWINKPATQEAKNAAYAALHGSDPTNGALYYFDDSTTNKWLWSKPIALRSGNMVYVY